MSERPPWLVRAVNRVLRPFGWTWTASRRQPGDPVYDQQEAFGQAKRQLRDALWAERRRFAVVFGSIWIATVVYLILATWQGWPT